jgi:alkanesulfonate monooxygenase SsuD/methylene tetrahydromethanopterin reductase-like flavin-dependent oxidoreductase (luciferase family)
LTAGREPAAVRRLLNIGGRFGPPSNQLLSGPPEQWVEQLAVLTREYGFTGYILARDDPTAIARFGREVAPALRELVAAERASTSGGPATATDAGR